MRQKRFDRTFILFMKKLHDDISSGFRVTEEYVFTRNLYKEYLDFVESRPGELPISKEAFSMHLSKIGIPAEFKFFKNLKQSVACRRITPESLERASIMLYDPTTDNSKAADSYSYSHIVTLNDKKYVMYVRMTPLEINHGLERLIFGEQIINSQEE